MPPHSKVFGALAATGTCSAASFLPTNAASEATSFTTSCALPDGTTGTADTTGAWYEKEVGPIDLDDGGGQLTACAARPAFSAVEAHLVLEQHASDFTAYQGCQ